MRSSCCRASRQGKSFRHGREAHAPADAVAQGRGLGCFLGHVRCSHPCLAAISRQAGARDCALRGGRHARCGRAHRQSAACRPDRAGVRGGEPAGRGRGRRRADRGGSAARRLHAACHLELVRRQSKLSQEAAVRRGARLRAREQSRGHRSLYPRGQSRPAGAHRSRTDRLARPASATASTWLPNCSSPSPGRRWCMCPTAGPRRPSPG
jgi:hypothetical protein